MRRRDFTSDLQEWVFKYAKKDEYDLNISLTNMIDRMGDSDPNIFVLKITPTEEDEEYKQEQSFTGKL